MPLFILFILFPAMTSLPSLAATQDSSPTEVTIYDKSTYLYYSENMSDPKFYQKGYINSRLRYAQSVANQLKPEYRKEWMEWNYSMAKLDALSEEWRGGLTSQLIKGTVGAAVGAAAGGGIPGALLGTSAGIGAGAAADSALGLWSRGGLSRLPTPNEAIEANMWGEEQKFGNDPVMKEISFRMDKEVEGRTGPINYDTDKNVVQRQRYDNLMQGITGGQKQILDKMFADGKITRKEFDELKAQAAANVEQLNNQALDAINHLRNIEQQGQRREQIENERQTNQLAQNNAAAPFALAASLARFFNDPEAERKFATMAQLASTMTQISQITVNNFKQQPFAVCNVYLMAATLAMNLISASQGPSEQEVMAQQFQRLAQQIDALRIQMHKRFDALEMHNYNYFTLTLIRLNDLKNSQELIASNVKRLNAQTEELQRAMSGGFNDLAQIQLAGWDASCFGKDKNNRLLPLANDRMANQCFSNYSLLAAGRFGDAIRLNKVESPLLPDDHHQDFRDLVKTVARNGGPTPVAVYPPAQFMYGTNKVLTLMRENPAYRQIAINGTWLNELGQPVYQQLVTNGESFTEFQRGMALASTGPSFKLRRAVFQDLINQYKNAAASAISHAHLINTKARGVGPTPGREANEEPARDLEGNYEIYKSDIFLCLSGQDGPERLRGSYNIYNYRADIDQRIERVYGYHEPAMHLTPEFYDYLPNSVRWVMRMQALQASSITFSSAVCMKKFNLHNVANSNDSAGSKIFADLELELIIGARYDFWNEKTQKTDHDYVEIKRLRGRRASWSESAYDPAWGEQLVTSAWTGDPRSEDGVRLFRFDETGTYGISHNPKIFFSEVAPSQDASDSVARWEARFAEAKARQKQAAFLAMKNEKAPLSAETSGILWQLHYLVSQGLNIQQPRVLELYNMLSSGALPSTDQIVATVIDKGLTPQEANKLIDDSVAPVQSLLDGLETATDLTPAPGSLDIYVSTLKQYQPAQ